MHSKLEFGDGVPTIRAGAMKAIGPPAVTDIGRVRRQVITLAVDNVEERDRRVVMCWALARVAGVEMVGLDLERFRVWVFGNGTVEALELVDELSVRGFRSTVFQHQLEIPA